MKKLTRKAKIISAVSAGVILSSTIIPLAVVLSLPNNKIHSDNLQTTNNDLKKVQIIVPDQLLENSAQNIAEYNALKEKQATFLETKNNIAFGNKYTLENDFLRFVFDDDLFTPDYIETHEVAKEFSKEAIMNTLITGQSLALGDKVNVMIEKYYPGFFLGEHGYSTGNNPNSIINLYWRSKAESENGNHFKTAVKKFSHEWGHHETTFAQNGSRMTGTLSYMHFNDAFNSIYSDYPNLYYRDIDRFYQDAKVNMTLTTNRNLFEGEFNWTSDLKYFYQIVSSLNFSGFTTWSLDIKNENNLLAELMTRLQLLYTINMLNAKSDLGDLADFASFSNYNFFNGADGLQSYNWIKTMLENIYQMNGMLHVKYSNGTNGQQVWVNGANNKLFDKLSKMVITYKDKSSAEMVIKNNQSPIGFYKNPFSPEYEYKYVVSEVYGKMVKIDKDISKDVDKIDFFDYLGNKIDNVSYDINEFLNDFY